jgi:2-polyprenyl-6-methoxyphenol hydroxylase-like FAD-dependent oxidoreductase
MRFLLLITLFYFNPLVGALSIVIIGGGPAGLATAIEAAKSGAEVTIVEKREHYTREQYVFLFETALNLLNAWEVTVPNFTVGHDGEGKVGYTTIQNLESGLSQRVRELGVHRVEGEFREIRQKTAIIRRENREFALPYDLLVGADGTHSMIRKQLGIDSKFLGRAQGLIAVLPIKNARVEFILPIRSDSLFINKVLIDPVTIISTQGKTVSKQELASHAKRQGWSEEAALILTDKARFFENVEVVLQQALQFSHREKSAILIGDAAAAASFLQGLGANTALESATVAGLLFKTERQESDYAAFDRAMQELTNKLIQDSAFLFD